MSTAVTGATDHVEAAMQRLVGQFLGRRYRIDGLIGVGGMGAVFRGYDASASRDVAIKLLRPELVDSVEAVSRFSREARAISRLQHPNCVRVTDVGQTQSGLRYMVMELIVGQSLTASLGRPMPLLRSLDIGRQILAGLEHAHTRNVVHRDIKPDNILLARAEHGREMVKLVDFGIARVLQESRDPEAFNTKMGQVFGTPQYMSPEQASGKEVDHRADIYTTGLVLFEMLTGKRAFDGNNAVAIVTKQLMEDPPRLPSTIPAPVHEIVSVLLRKEPANRYQTAGQARGALDRVRQELRATGWKDDPIPDIPRPGMTGIYGASPAENSGASEINDAMKAILATSTQKAIEGLGDAGSFIPTEPGLRRGPNSITEMSGIDLDNLELDDLGEIGDRDD